MAVEGIEVRGQAPLESGFAKLLIAVDPNQGGRAAGEAAAKFLIAYASVITHRKTGALASSFVLELPAKGIRGFFRRLLRQNVGETAISIDRGAVNIAGQKPYVYGFYEHRRGGDHAFFQRTVDEAGDEALRTAGDVIRGMLPGGSVTGRAMRFFQNVQANS